MPRQFSNRNEALWKPSCSRRNFLLRGTLALAAGGTIAASGNLLRAAEFGPAFSGVSSASARADAANKFSGIFAILSTPFDPADEIVWDDLQREVNFCVRAGVQGMVWPQLFAEFNHLSEGERRRGAEVILRTTAGRAPVVIGVQAPERGLAIDFARHAQSHGARAVISLPPYTGAQTLEASRDYYQALAQAVPLPVFIQNSGPPWGTALPVDFVIGLARENPQFGYVKEEVAPVAHRIGEYTRSGVMKGIFSGNGGRNFLDEFAHGANGTMPACEFIEADVKICSLAIQNRMEEARGIFAKLLPMINLEGIYGVAFAKEVLVRRGIFTSAKVRGVAGEALDAKDREELEAWWKELAPELLSPPLSWNSPSGG